LKATDVCVVLTTAPDPGVAAALVEQLVRVGHAACGTILPGATSIYKWKGAVERESEVVVILKTTVGAQAALLQEAKRLHPYDVPELLVLPVADGDADYLAWVAGVTVGGTTGEAGAGSD